MMNKNCLEWLKFSKIYIDVAQQLFSQQKNPRHRPIEIILYHCQQGAEKALKAYMVSNGMFPPKIHEMQELRIACNQWDSKFDSVRLIGYCSFLDPFAVITRYPKHNLKLNSAIAQRGLNSAKRVYDFVCKRLGLDSVYF
ncbi:MAG: HEPN domain-containing protein [Oscillospiraceae bacterium]|nr:HEPN domain-containing protein [Oscillospiraceae bacterium]